MPKFDLLKSKPKGQAIIADTAQKVSWNKAHFFYVAQIDGREAKNNLKHTQARNGQQNLEINPVDFQRPVPAQELTLVLRGKTEYGSKNAANDIYRVAGIITFTPQPNQTYFVKGSLGPEYSAVWLETASGQVVSKKVEIGRSS